jgi:hypothetical protein
LAGSYPPNDKKEYRYFKKIVTIISPLSIRKRKMPAKKSKTTTKKPMPKKKVVKKDAKKSVTDKKTVKSTKSKKA